jgi:RNA polymerase sigma-70 factor, ECF subfamily
MADLMTSGLEPTDQELISRWQAGDEAAATALVRRHADAIGRFVVAQGEREHVEEVVQDTFVRAFASLDDFRGDSSLRTWLFTIARNLVRDRVRSARRMGRQVEIEEAHAVTEHDALDAAVADEAEERVLLAVERLSPMQRSVFTLRVGEGLSYREIAAALETSEGAARVHYHNAMRAVKEFIDE